MYEDSARVTCVDYVGVVEYANQKLVGIVIEVVRRLAVVKDIHHRRSMTASPSKCKSTPIGTSAWHLVVFTALQLTRHQKQMPAVVIAGSITAGGSQRS